MSSPNLESLLYSKNIAFHTQKRWTSWNFRKFPPRRVCSKCRVSGDHFHRMSVEERQSRANWWSIRGTYKVKTYTFWTGPIVRQEGNGSIPLKSLLKVFFACMFCVHVKKEQKSLTLSRTYRSWRQECDTLIQPNSLVLHGGLNMMARVKCSSEQGFLRSASASSMWGMCGEKEKSVSHPTSECSKLAQREYRRRHNNAARYVHWQRCGQNWNGQISDTNIPQSTW